MKRRSFLKALGAVSVSPLICKDFFIQETQAQINQVPRPELVKPADSKIVKELTDAEKRREKAKEVSKLIREIVEENSLARKLAKVDYLEPGQQAAYKILEDSPVYILPKVGAIPRNYLETGAGGEIYVPTFTVAGACEYPLTEAEDEEVVNRAYQETANTIVGYENESLMRVLVPAATAKFTGSGLLPARPPAIVQISGGPASGFFSKELVNQMIIRMERNRRTLTHLLISPEDMADMREWGEPSHEEGNRREIFVSGGSNSLWNINIMTRQELGVCGKWNINSSDSEYGLFRLGSAGTFNDYTPENPNVVGIDGKVIKMGETQVYGLDLSNLEEEEPIVMPVRQDLDFYDDPTLYKSKLEGYYGWEEVGMMVKDPTRICVGIIDRSVQ